METDYVRHMREGGTYAFDAATAVIAMETWNALRVTSETRVK
jgi:hypothetical protein